MSQPTDNPEQPPGGRAAADERLLLTALARFVLGQPAELQVVTSEAGTMLTATTDDPFHSPRLFLDRAAAAVYVVPRHIRDLAQVADLVADPRSRSALEVVWRAPSPTATTTPEKAASDTVTVVMTETIVFKHTVTRTELAEALSCAPADVEQQITDRGDDDKVWLRETLAEHFDHVSDRDLSVEVTR